MSSPPISKTLLSKPSLIPVEDLLIGRARNSCREHSDTNRTRFRGRA